MDHLHLRFVNAEVYNTRVGSGFDHACPILETVEICPTWGWCWTWN